MMDHRLRNLLLSLCALVYCPEHCKTQLYYKLFELSSLNRTLLASL